jgi:hypothetical protein
MADKSKFFLVFLVLLVSYQPAGNGEPWAGPQVAKSQK